MSDDDTRSFDDVRDEVTSEDNTDMAERVDSVAPDVFAMATDDSFNQPEPIDDAKETKGTIDGYGFSLRVDGDAPAGLVADIESALAEVKQERENDEVDIQEYAESVNAINISGERLMNGKLRYEIEVPTLKQDISHYPDGFELEEIGDKCIELIEV